MNANRFHKSEKPEKEVPPIGAMPPEMALQPNRTMDLGFIPAKLKF